MATDNTPELTVYIDVKSPYAFIALEPTLALEHELGLQFHWIPLTLDIPSYLGSAKKNDAGQIVENNRTKSQWSGVKYAYKDARRYAALQDRTLLGTQKIWDSTLASIGLLFAKEQGKAEAYTDLIFKRFWQRELDIENSEIIKAVLQEAKVKTEKFQDFVVGKGPALHDAIREEAEAIGVFGVPMYILDGELYWGREHLPLIRQKLTDKDLARSALVAKSPDNAPNAASRMT